MGEQSEVIHLSSSLDSPNKNTALVGRVIADRKINWGTVMGVLKWSWSDLGEVRISGLKANVFLFDFKEEKGAVRALEEGPWSIDGHCLNIVKWDHNKRLDELNLDTISFWIQIHGLQRDQMMIENAYKIAQKAGKVVEVDENVGVFGVCGCYLRAKVMIKVDEPLSKGTWVLGQKDEKYWIDFKYERLSAFCFRCGKMDHTIKTCKKEIENEDHGKYGPWLRANQVKVSQFVINGSKSDSWNNQGNRKNKQSASSSEQEIDSNTTSASQGKTNSTFGDKEEDKEEDKENFHENYEQAQNKEKVVVEEAQKQSVFEEQVKVCEENNDYFVELPSDGEGEDNSKALIPFSLTEALKKLSLKRKSEDEVLDTRSVKRRVIEKEEKTSDITSPKTVKKRKGKREQKKWPNKSKKGTKRNQMNALIEVPVELNAELSLGFGGLPGKATEMQ